MRSGRSLHLLLLFWGDFALCTYVSMYTDYFEGNCGLFHHNYTKCGQPVDRFFFNVLSKKCEHYVGYDCPIPRNSFNTTEQCEEYCAPKNICQMPLGKSYCFSSRERWYFDPETKSCKGINHKGCTGNNNNFERKWLCERLCL